MALNQAYPSLNGVEPSWADIQVTCQVLNGPLIQTDGFAAIKWSRKVEVGVRRGASGGRIMARTTGQGDQDASCTLYRSALQTLKVGLMTAASAAGLVRGNQVIISLVSFDVIIQHTPPTLTQDWTLYETQLKGCRFLGDSDDNKEGSDPDKVDVTLNPIEIVDLINGQEVVLL